MLELKERAGASYVPATAGGPTIPGTYGDQYGGREDNQEVGTVPAVEKENHRVEGQPGRGEEAGRESREEAERVEDEDGGDDEPVIIWTPVVEYRGSLNYWTVHMTGWRTEKNTDEDSDTKVDTAAAAAAATTTIEQEHAQRSDEQDKRGSSGVVRGVTTGRELCPTGCQAIVDTGSSLLVPPRSQYEAVMQQILGGRSDCQERGGMMSCSKCKPEDFPDIVISVAVGSEGNSPAPPWTPIDGFNGDGGFIGDDDLGRGMQQEFRLKPSDYLSVSWDACAILVGEGQATDIWTLGDAFIKTYMTIFDVANLRVGFVCADGGRCLGGASPLWRPSTHSCWPFLSSVTDTSENAEAPGSYCLYLHYSLVGWVLMAASVLLFLAGCLLYAEESASSRSSSAHAVASSSSVSPQHPFLITDQQGRPQQDIPEVRASGDGKSEASCDGEGGGGGSTPPRGFVDVVGGKGGGKSSTQRSQDDRRKGRDAGALPSSTRRSKYFLLSFLARTKATSARSPPPTRSPSSEPPSKTKHAAADQERSRPFRSYLGGGSGGRSSDGGGAVSSVVTLSGDGIRSRAGTPRLACCASSSPVGG